MAKQLSLFEPPDDGLRCYYGTPWLDHFQPPIGSGRGCWQCQTPFYRELEKEGNDGHAGEPVAHADKQ